MKKTKALVSVLSLAVVVFGLTLSGCGQKSEEESAADSVSNQADAAAKTAEKEAAALKEAAEKEAAKH